MPYFPQGIYFGSEISCLRQAGVPLETDADALRLYFQFNYIPDPLTAYRAIRRIPAGGWLTYERGKVEQGRYWRMPVADGDGGPGFHACRRGSAGAREVRRGGAHSHDRGRPAGRVSQWRHRFELGGGVDGAAIAGPDQDVLHRVRGEPLQRAAVCAHGGGAVQDGAPRNRRAARFDRHHTQVREALWRAVRGLVARSRRSS